MVRLRSSRATAKVVSSCTSALRAVTRLPSASTDVEVAAEAALVAQHRQPPLLRGHLDGLLLQLDALADLLEVAHRLAHLLLDLELALAHAALAAADLDLREGAVRALGYCWSG